MNFQRWDDANCLPYYPIFTADELMSIDEREAVCEGCPLLRQCAAYAVTTFPDGVVHAGVYLPSEQETRGVKGGRNRALARLRRIANGIGRAAA